MDYRLEPPCDDPREDVWNNKALREEYHDNVVSKVLLQSWAIDEIESGESTIQDVIEGIWEGYEKWCDERYQYAMEERYS